MYFTDDSLLPENQQPLMITVAPYGLEWYNSVDETLSALGLPPNREGGQQGFIVHKTDGRVFTNEAGLHPVML